MPKIISVLYMAIGIFFIAFIRKLKKSISLQTLVCFSIQHMREPRLKEV
jgi:hypothetical protein